MKSEFAFDATTTYNGEITISDIQNTCIEVLDNQGMISYLLIYTDEGRSYTVEAGPFVPDSTELPDVSSLVMSQFDTSEYKCKKQITKFLQPKDKGKRKAIEVREIYSGEAITNIRMAFDVNLIRLTDVIHIGEDIDKAEEDEDVDI